MSDSRHFCPLCTASFRRQEHLDRHRMGHREDRPFHCLFCSHSFKRSDVLQRHWRTCKPRLDAGADIPRIPHGPRPKKRRACDGCVRLKKACNLALPCEACRARRQECTYTHSKQSPQVATQLSSQSDSVLSPERGYDQADPLLPHEVSLIGANLRGSCMTPSDTFASLVESGCALTFAQSTPAGGDPALGQELSTCGTFAFGEFRFLDRFTSVTGFMSSFECMRVSEARQLAKIVSNLPHEESPDIDDEPCADLFSLDFFPLSSSILTHGESSDNNPDPGLETCRNCTSWLSDPLAAVTNEIVCRLKDVTQHPGPGSSITLTWSPFIEQVCFDFFSPRNIRRYLVFFWSLWYPNCPIIHRPTFEVHNTPLILLLVMLLIGASFAPEEAVHRNAKLWCNSAEEFVFADQHFRRSVVLGDGTEANFRLRRDALKVLQAAYLICLLQNWEGDGDSKRRIRRARFSMVTAIARELGFAPGSHHEPPRGNGDWERFIAREEFNRTLSYIFLLDTAFVIFNNTPPKVSISELNFDPVCPERCFQAQTAAECFLHLFERDIISSPLASLSIKALVSRICHTDIDAAEREYTAGLGKLNLFVIVSAFHTLLFHARNTFTPQAATIPIQQGLNNWKTIWNQHETANSLHQLSYSDLPSAKESWKRTGFMEYAPEYWTLAQAIILSAQQTQAICDSEASSNSGLGMMLSRFDENDMKQLNRFIKWVRREGLVRG
ncbi:hypothetical protein BDV12DRAFT_207682 [Aspergillus spectabilis]